MHTNKYIDSPSSWCSSPLKATIVPFEAKFNGPVTFKPLSILISPDTFNLLNYYLK